VSVAASVYVPILSPGTHFIHFLLAQNPAKEKNGFSGSIPSEVGSLTALTTLDLGRCNSQLLKRELAVVSVAVLTLSSFALTQSL
jgi:hypothetical protein